MKILVTGGAGFIGTNLIKQLLKQGHYVVSLDNYSTGIKKNHIDNPNVVYVESDILNLTEHNSSFWSKFDLVYHLAAIARIQPSFNNPLDYFKVNTLATMKLAEECSKSDIPLIYAGSSSHHSGKYKNPYTFSKTSGEEVLEMFKQNFGLKYVIARFYNVYGPHQLTEGGYTTLIGRWIGNIQNARPCVIYGDGEQRRDFTHVDDIVQGLIKMNSDKVLSIYNGYNFPYFSTPNPCYRNYVLQHIYVLLIRKSWDNRDELKYLHQLLKLGHNPHHHFPIIPVHNIFAK